MDKVTQIETLNAGFYINKLIKVMIDISACTHWKTYSHVSVDIISDANKLIGRYFNDEEISTQEVKEMLSKL